MIIFSSILCVSFYLICRYLAYCRKWQLSQQSLKTIIETAKAANSLHEELDLLFLSTAHKKIESAQNVTYRFNEKSSWWHFGYFFEIKITTNNNQIELSAEPRLIPTFSDNKILEKWKNKIS